MKVGDRVIVKQGDGIIVGKDMPDSRCPRWVVRVDNPGPDYIEMVARFDNAELCYFSREVLTKTKGE